jgi:hypothetical protein
LIPGEIRSRPQHRPPSDLLRQRHGGGVVRFEQRLAQRHRILSSGALVARDPHAFGCLNGDLSEPVDGRDR